MEVGEWEEMKNEILSFSYMNDSRMYSYLSINKYLVQERKYEPCFIPQA